MRTVTIVIGAIGIRREVRRVQTRYELRRSIYRRAIADVPDKTAPSTTRGEPDSLSRYLQQIEIVQILERVAADARDSIGVEQE